MFYRVKLPVEALAESRCAGVGLSSYFGAVLHVMSC